MKLFLKYFISLFVLILSISFCAFALPLKINDVINESKQFDAKEIIIEGEAIGHLMQRGDFVWLNINDGSNCIGIWANLGPMPKIENLGRHAVVGDWIEVKGIFNAKCPMHGGDSDVHANSIKVLKRGHVVELTYSHKKVNILIFLTGLLICLFIIKTLRRAR